ncbi:MAG: HNH endonuclease [bacterium]
MPTIKKSQHRPWMPERVPFGRRAHANTKFYASTAWRRVRARYISLHPICEICGRAAAEVVDHIVPINQGGAPLDESNFQALCSTCHNRKSGRESRGQKG